jgi:hypothetical protein
MLYALMTVGFVFLAAVTAFVWTVVRTAVEQAVDNRRREHRTEPPVAWWETADPDAPADFWPTYTDPRAASVQDSRPVRSPGVRPQPMPRATEELKRKAY